MEKKTSIYQFISLEGGGGATEGMRVGLKLLVQNLSW